MLDRKRTRVGSDVWGVFHQGSTKPWRVGLVGKVVRVTGEGAYVNQRVGRQVVERLVGWTEHPIENTREAMQAWADEHPPASPGISPLVSS
jgi:hypothetical protein